MKKNDGYILPFVLVVFLVISMVAVTILTVSMTNLHNQKASVQRMQDQYTAQGKIERVTAQITNYPTGNAFNEGCLKAFCVSEDVTAEDWKYNAGTLSFVLRSAENTVEITCEVVITEVAQEQVDPNVYQYLIDGTKLAYEAYTITTIEPVDAEAEVATQ